MENIKEESPTKFDGVLPETEENAVRETEYVEERMISADNILENMHPREVVKFINNLYVESADAAKDALFESYGEKVKTLVRDFFKSQETWFRKHKITKFNEKYALISIINARLALMVQKQVAEALDKLGEKEFKK